MRQDVVVWTQVFRNRANIFLQWHDPITGRRRTKSSGTADPDRAEQARSDLEYELRHDLFAEPARLSWQAFADLYQHEKLSGSRQATRVKAAGVLAQFADRANVTSLAGADERALSRYAAKLREAGRRTATIHAHLAYLKAALRWAAEQRLLPRAPNVAMPRLPKRVFIRTVSEADFARLLAACPSDLWRLFLWAAWHTGLRRSELLSLVWEVEGQWPWIDLPRRRVWLPAEFVKADADQWVPIHPDLLAMLRKARQPSGWVFPLSASAKEASRSFTRIADRAGVRAGLHDLRRTFGSRYAPHVPAQILQRLMRHGDIKTTMRFYADVDGALDDAILKAPPVKPKRRAS